MKSRYRLWCAVDPTVPRIADSLMAASIYATKRQARDCVFPRKPVMRCTITIEPPKPRGKKR